MPAERFIEAIKDHPEAYVGMSALLTTTMASMENINKKIKEIYPEIITFIGGAPISNDFAQKIGANYYTSGPQEMVTILDNLNVS